MSFAELSVNTHDRREPDSTAGHKLMNKVPDDIPLQELCLKAAQALARAGMQHRIDIYRDVEVDDPAVRMMLGRAHRIRIRVKITAASLLFENDELGEGGGVGVGHAAVPPAEDAPAVVNGRAAVGFNGAASGEPATASRRPASVQRDRQEA